MYTYGLIDKLHKIAYKLLTTERAYVDILHLLGQVCIDIHMDLQTAYELLTNKRGYVDRLHLLGQVCINIPLYIWTDRQTS